MLPPPARKRAFASRRSIGDLRLGVFLALALLLGAVLAEQAVAKATAPPKLLAPSGGAASSSPFHVEYELSEEAAPGSVVLSFANEESSTVTTVQLEDRDGTQGDHSVELSLFDLSGSAGVQSASGNTLPDGTYEVRLAYQNIEGAPAASTSAAKVEIKTVTRAPTLSKPASGEVFEAPFEVEYTLPEAAHSGSVELRFAGEASGTQTVVLQNAAAGAHTVVIDPKAVLSTSGISSGPSELPADRYQLSVVYQDALENPDASSIAVEVRIVDTPLCAPGHYSETGESPCQPAPAGHYAEGSGATAAIACEPGTYNPSEGSSSTAACLEDEAGHYSEPGASQQLSCVAGTYQPDTGQFECKSATLGHYVPAQGAGSEIECEAGTYSSTAQATVCEVDPIGRFSGTGASSASPCEQGTYAPSTHSAQCTSASVGYYVEGSAAGAQLPCAAGTYAPSEHSSSCLPATLGHYVPTQGAGSEIECEAGTYSAVMQSTACTEASPGHYVASSAAGEQAACAPGSYARSSRSTSCTPTPAGTFAPGAGATAPSTCPIGTTSGAGASSCAIVPSTTSAPLAASEPQTPSSKPDVIVAGPRRQTSIRRAREQAYTLRCSTSATLLVRASITISLAEKHIEITARERTVACVAGKATAENASFKLTKASLELLAHGNARITLSVSVYHAGELLASKRLRGQR